MAKKKAEKKAEPISLKDYDEVWLAGQPDHPHYYLIEEAEKKKEKKEE